MAKIEFAWELGAGTGHVATLLPIAAAMKTRGHDARFLLRDLSAGADLDGAAQIPRESAHIWSWPPTCEAPLSLGEILLNFERGAALATIIARIEAALQRSR